MNEMGIWIGALIGVVVSIGAWRQIKTPRETLFQTKCLSGIFYWLGKYQLCDKCDRLLFQNNDKTAWLVKQVAIVTLPLGFKKFFTLKRFCYCLNCAPKSVDAIGLSLSEENAFAVEAE